MKTIEQKRAKVRKSQKALRKKLIKQGICRDCGQISGRSGAHGHQETAADSLRRLPDEAQGPG